MTDVFRLVSFCIFFTGWQGQWRSKEGGERRDGKKFGDNKFGGDNRNNRDNRDNNKFGGAYFQN